METEHAKPLWYQSKVAKWLGATVVVLLLALAGYVVNQALQDHVGDDAVVNNNADSSDCRGNTSLGYTKDGSDKIAKYAASKDTLSIAELAATNGAFHVKNCTKVKIRAIDASTRQVRILEGEKQGKEGYVSTQWVHKH